MNIEVADKISKLLQSRIGLPTQATLEDGSTIMVHNIAWGRDMGATHDHITTNVSPTPDGQHTVDLFTTDQVVLLVALDSGAVLYRRASGDT